MKAALALCILYFIGFARGGLLSNAALIRTPSLDNAIINSHRIGGNFAYSTVEGHAYTAAAPVIQRVSQPLAISYATHQVPVGYATGPVALSQPPYAHSIFGHYTPSVVSSPLYSGVLGQYPFVAHNPIVGQYPFFGQAPVVGQGPVIGQNPIIGQAPGIGQIPVQTPVQTPIQSPVGPVQGIPQADPAGQGTIVDDDTVSIESA